jgi:hypothetical protein
MLLKTEPAPLAVTGRIINAIMEKWNDIDGEYLHVDDIRNLQISAAGCYAIYVE